MSKAIMGRALTFLVMMGIFATIMVAGYFGWYILGYQYLGMDYLEYVYYTISEPTTAYKIQWILCGLWLIFGTEITYREFIK
jgi:hypothetical protein